MTHSFRCDRCEKFSEGRPEFTLQRYTYMNGENTAFTSDHLCKKCFTKYVEDFINGDT